MDFVLIDDVDFQWLSATGYICSNSLTNIGDRYVVRSAGNRCAANGDTRCDCTLDQCDQCHREKTHRLTRTLGVHCHVIAPRKLDEQCTRVKTDPRDAATLCQRLSRYVEGNTPELAVIRVPSEAEEQARHVSRQREQLVRHRQKLEAQGRSLLINHSLPAPAHWWKNQTWSRLSKLLPAWICLRLEIHRPALLTLEQQISALSAELQAAAPRRCSGRRRRTNYRGDDARDLLVGALSLDGNLSSISASIEGKCL